MKIAIIGKGVTRYKAPQDGWQRWGLASDPQPDLLDRLFEVHRPQDYLAWNGHIHNLAHFRDRLVIRYANSDLPEAEIYPWQEVKEISEDFACSISYILAAAIMEKPEIIGLWGCDLAPPEYERDQLPNIQFWRGVARGRGIELQHAEPNNFECRYGQIY